VFLDRCSGESGKIPGFERWSHFSEAGDRVQGSGVKRDIIGCLSLDGS